MILNYTLTTFRRTMRLNVKGISKKTLSFQIGKYTKKMKHVSFCAKNRVSENDREKNK